MSYSMASLVRWAGGPSRLRNIIYGQLRYYLYNSINYVCLFHSFNYIYSNINDYFLGAQQCAVSECVYETIKVQAKDRKTERVTREK